jgi:uncharacterized Zn-finger protein
MIMNPRRARDRARRRRMEQREIIEVNATDETAACDGGGGALGHPLVYLHFEGKPSVDCYYCSRRFVKPGHVEPAKTSAA